MDGQNLISHQFCHPGINQIKNAGVALSLRYGFNSSRISLIRNPDALAVRGKDTRLSHVKGNHNRDGESLSNSQAIAKKGIVLNQKKGKKQHHLWQKRDSAGSGQKAFNLVRIISDLPNEKEAVYRALDKWTAWEVEFPLIAVAKALRKLKSRKQWLRVIQVAKWMLGKGQGATMGTYDTLLLAFDVDGRVDEAESLWNMILHTHTRSISKRLFSRMISLYDHHDMQDKIIEVFADMEELGVRPDEDTVRRVARAFGGLGQEEKRTLFLKRYQCKWKYIHFNGERVRVSRHTLEEDE
ncbi:pentatricopeptide repeat-containing protein At4g18975, chloroplastic isoform X2 [Rhodamnia argentea]|uniref:Pentatricopeptide repeat-containing protein At4g18975, chloroplastic isoform X2 n=1 Tax=Rhodamnia argentea TaxID=178133 RepID=A0A8B8QJP0_9MYRT|nr:pentatricopeptide repeat-containing protein At4g18975, chloroplastic isoform X2 [Rhodamnia argentea]